MQQQIQFDVLGCKISLKKTHFVPALYKLAHTSGITSIVCLFSLITSHYTVVVVDLKVINHVTSYAVNLCVYI